MALTGKRRFVVILEHHENLKKILGALSQLSKLIGKGEVESIFLVKQRGGAMSLSKTKVY